MPVRLHWQAKGGIVQCALDRHAAHLESINSRTSYQPSSPSPAIFIAKPRSVPLARRASRRLVTLGLTFPHENAREHGWANADLADIRPGDGPRLEPAASARDRDIDPAQSLQPIHGERSRRHRVQAK